ncbi:MAG: cobalamin-dependent protein [Verrucomicrobiota bacterium]|nr:cobalamin-dependent protein [Verrucomicrobiota bacterium]
MALIRSSDLVGFSLMSQDVRTLMPPVRRIRQEQRIPTIGGGIHPTALPRESLDDFDYVCVGEGEEPLRQLHERIREGNRDASDIANIGFNKGSEKILPVECWFVRDLDDLPFPDYRFARSFVLRENPPGARPGRTMVRIPSAPAAKRELFRSDALLFYSQRGCNMACTYCSNSLYHAMARQAGARWYRVTSAGRVKAELQSHLSQLPGLDHVWLNDDDLLAREPSELEDISSFLKNALRVTFNINAIPRHVTEEKITILARNGLR